MAAFSWRGIGWAALSIVCWGTTFPAGRYLMANQSLDSVMLVFTRYMAASLLMMGISVVIRRPSVFRALSRRDWLELNGHGITLAVMSILLFAAQKTIPVLNASMVEAISPLLIFLVSLLTGCRASLLQCAGLALGFLGCMFVMRVADATGIHLTSFSFGDFLIVLSGLAWALYTVLGRSLAVRLGGYTFTAWSMFFGGFWTFLYLLFEPSRLYLPDTLFENLLVLYMALVPSALAFFAWNAAQKYIPLGLLALSEYFTPVIASLLGLFFLNEGISLFQVAGMVLVFGAALVEPEISSRLHRFFRKRSIFFQ